MTNNLKNQKNQLWLSLGENCLSDDILKRHFIKSFSTPYSSGRSNIDYAITLEENNYENLLNKNSLEYHEAWGSKVVRSTEINKSSKIFESSCNQGFEFTHHNVIESQKDYDSYQRKCNRMQHIDQDVVFLYHHRINNNSNITLLREKLNKFTNIYKSKNIDCTIILFYQKIIPEGIERKLIQHTPNQSIIEFEFQNHFIWGGNNQDVFWARIDDDLIKSMLITSQNIIDSKNRS